MLDGDPAVHNDAARAGTQEARASVAALGDGSFIGAILAKPRVISATLWRDPFTHPRNIMRRQRQRTHKSGLRRVDENFL